MRITLCSPWCPPHVRPCAFKEASSTGKDPPQTCHGTGTAANLSPRMGYTGLTPAQAPGLTSGTLVGRDFWRSFKTHGIWWFQLCYAPSSCQLTPPTANSRLLQWAKHHTRVHHHSLKWVLLLLPTQFYSGGDRGPEGSGNSPKVKKWGCGI